MLYIVSTPIGNLKDITLRALDILKEVDVIAAEDTRRTGILLKHHSIKNRMLSYNDHNRSRRIPELLSMLRDGKDVALVSDSGTPGISDPGYRLIKAAIENSFPVSPIPGPTALISALVSSGLPTDSYEFHGFLPKKQKRKEELLKNIKKTAIFYESPHRIEKTLQLMQKAMPEARVCLARELTKKFEEFIRGTPEEIIGKIGKKKLKGEIVLVVYG